MGRGLVLSLCRCLGRGASPLSGASGELPRLHSSLPARVGVRVVGRGEKGGGNRLVVSEVFMVGAKAHWSWMVVADTASLLVRLWERGRAGPVQLCGCEQQVGGPRENSSGCFGLCWLTRC